MSDRSVAEIARGVRLLLLDVDGVLTDGRISLFPMPDGRVEEIKTFDVTDGAGLTLARKAGLRTGIVTRRHCTVVDHRARELSMDFVYNGISDKAVALSEICEMSGIDAGATCYMGDDIHDLPILNRVGFPAAPANARPEVLAVALFTTQSSGGRGAVRELIEFILQCQGNWPVRDRT